nr:PREDICTED: uncharacterized protein LOC109033482 isoform X4 [Bemisia tabaci]
MSGCTSNKQENSELYDELPPLISPSSSHKKLVKDDSDEFTSGCHNYTAGGYSSDKFAPQHSSSNTLHNNKYYQEFPSSSSDQSTSEDDSDEDSLACSSNAAGRNCANDYDLNKDPSTNKKFYHAFSSASSYSNSTEDDPEKYTPVHDKDTAGTYSSDEFEPNACSPSTAGFTSVNNTFKEQDHFRNPSNSMLNQNSLDNHLATFNSSHVKHSANLSQSNSGISQRKGQNLNLLPVNLLQDTWSIKLNSLPTTYQNILQDLTRKVESYQLNFFTPKIDDQSEIKLQLICNLCDITVPVIRFESHVQDQKHLHKLAEKAHHSNLNFSKHPIEIKPDATLNAESKDQPIINFENSSKTAEAAHEKAAQALIKCLKTEDKRIGNDLLRRIEYEIINFKPTYEYNKLYFSCKLCWLKLLPENVESHIHTAAHLTRSEQNFSQRKQQAHEDKVDDKKIRRDSYCPPNEVKETLASTGKNVHEREKKIIMDFGKDADKILESFELTYCNGNQLNFICDVCQLCLYPKYVRSHLNSCSGVRNLMKNLCLVYLEDLNAVNKGILNRLVNRLDDQVIFFQLHYRFGSNRLRFFCYVCHLVLNSEEVDHHAHSGMHEKKLKKQPFSLKIESLNEPNRLIVEKITDAIKEGISDFSLSYKIGTKELYFYCKLCQRTLSPDAVESHAKLSQHLSLVPVKKCNFPAVQDSPDSNFVPQQVSHNTMPVFSNDFAQPEKTTASLAEINVNKKVAHMSERDKKIILGFGQDAERILNSFELSYKNAKKLNFICNVCKLCLYPKYVLSHLNSCSKVENLLSDLCLVFFQDLNNMNKEILNKLICQLNNRLIFLQLHYKFGTNRLRFFCQLCLVVLITEDVQGHVSSKEHERNLKTKSFSLRLESLNQPNFLFVNEISSKIKERMADFSLLHKIGTEELIFYCKLCQITLNPEKMEEHVKSSQHLSHLPLKYDISEQKDHHLNFKLFSHQITPSTGSRSTDGEERKETPVTFAKTRVSDKVASSIHHLNERDKKIISNFGKQAGKILNSFTREYDNLDRLNFICKICKLSLAARYVRSHLHNCTGLENVMKNFQFVNLEDLNAKNTTIVKHLSNSHESKLYIFQLLLGAGSNELFFFCKACNLILGSELVEDHIFCNSHQQFLLSNPPRTAYQSLSKTNQQTITCIANVIGNRISDFNFVYKIGTEELQFLCKVCHELVHPDVVKDHVKYKKHLEHVKAILGNSHGVMDKIPRPPTSVGETSNAMSEPSNLVSKFPSINKEFSIVSFDDLSEIQQKLVQLSISKEDFKFFEFLLTTESSKLSLRCLLCDLTLECPVVLAHVLSSDHANNEKLNGFLDQFIHVDESSKNKLRNLFMLIDSQVSSFLLLPLSDRGRHKIKCKICGLSVFLNTVNPKWLAEHLQSHSREIKGVDSNRIEALTSNDSKFVTCKNPQEQKVEQESCLQSASSEIKTTVIPLNTDQNKSNIANKNSYIKEEPVKKLKDLNPTSSNKDDVAGPFVCRDCNANLNSKRAGDNKLFVRCHGKSNEKTLSSLNERQSTAKAEPLVPGSEIISKLDKQIFKNLIDEIGFEMKDFDLMLEPTSKELRFKCKFCLFILRPESMESHIKTGYHLKLSKMAGLQNLGFEALSATGKETVKDIFNVVGSGIQCLAVETTVHFFCKPCSAHLSADDVKNHFLTEEHRKRSSTHVNVTELSSSKSPPTSGFTVPNNNANEISDTTKIPTLGKENLTSKINFPLKIPANSFSFHKAEPVAEKIKTSTPTLRKETPQSTTNLQSKIPADPVSFKKAEIVTEKTSAIGLNIMNLPKKKVLPNSAGNLINSGAYPKKMTADDDNSFEIIERPQQMSKSCVGEVFNQHPQTKSSYKKRDVAPSPFSKSSSMIFPEQRLPKAVTTSQRASSISTRMMNDLSRTSERILKPKPVTSSQNFPTSSLNIEKSSPQHTSRMTLEPEPVNKYESRLSEERQASNWKLVDNSLPDLTSKPKLPQVIKPQNSLNSSSSGGGKSKNSDKSSSKDSCSLM